LNQQVTEQVSAVSSFALSDAIKKADFSGCAATVVGYGNIGKQHVKALRALGVGQIRVCSRSAGPLEELDGVAGVSVLPGGIEGLDCDPAPNELGIVATPTEMLVPAARRLASLGFRRILIEKPVSLWSEEIVGLATDFEQQGIDAICGYNRATYPSFHEIKYRTLNEGGITSCTYSFTELIKPDWVERYPAGELARWGVSNSLNPISMAHGLIGMPKTWGCHRSGSLPWHKNGSVFVGSGISESGIPFAYHADWGSQGRWSVEVHTSASSYRLCPLERVQRKTDALSEWENVEISVCHPGVKEGLAEEIGAMLSPDIRRIVPLFSLAESASLTGYGEEVFGYETRLEARS